MRYLEQCGEVLKEASWAGTTWLVHPYLGDGVDLENWIECTGNEYRLFDALQHREGARILRDGRFITEAKTDMESSVTAQADSIG